MKSDEIYESSKMGGRSQGVSERETCQNEVARTESLVVGAVRSTCVMVDGQAC